MKVLVLPADDGGCGHYRCIWVADALAAQGADVTHAGVFDDSGLHGSWQPVEDGPDELVSLDVIPDADVFVIQRPLQRDRLTLIRLLQAAGRRVVVEIDDDFSCLHPRNASWRSCHPQHSPYRNWDNLAQACRIADWVTCTTAALARRYGAHGRCTVVPNMVPASYLQASRDLQAVGPIVGWTGSIETHPTDLQCTRGAVQRAVEGTTAVVAVVGAGTGVKAALGLTASPLAAGWLPLERYPEAMAQFDLGIVPLADIAFNHAKSALKMMEMAAVGVPAVVSPTPDNLRMHALGIGLVARRPREWERHLSNLIAGEGWRAEMGGIGRQVMADHTIEGNADRWWDAWSSCLDREKVA
jgi:glycosyltransferase involved in cell wall biosynthesis